MGEIASELRRGREDIREWREEMREWREEMSGEEIEEG